MGFGARTSALDTLDRIKDLPARDGAEKSEARGSNAMPFPGFYEMDRVDLTDGGVTGEVMRFTDSSHARSIGQFNISGDGKVLRFPGLTDAERKAIETGDFAPVTPKAPAKRRGPKARRGLLR